MVWTRRKWLQGSIAGLVATQTDWLSAESSSSKLEIIDCHTHFYDPTRPEGVSWPPENSSLYRTVLPKHLKAQPQFRTITGTVVVEAVARLEDNQWMLDLAEEDPFIVGIVGRLDPGTPDFSHHLKRFSRNRLFRGIRVSAQQVEELLEQKKLDDLRLMAELDLSLDVNGNPSTPALLAKLAKELPQLRIVLNHIGNVKVTGQAPPESWAKGIALAAAFPNVYCKVSALVEGAARVSKPVPRDLGYYRPSLDVVWDAFGEDRVIYGSNWPVCERAADYATMQRISTKYAMEKGPAATRKFCSENARSAYKWIDREGRG